MRVTAISARSGATSTHHRARFGQNDEAIMNVMRKINKSAFLPA